MKKLPIGIQSIEKILKKDEYIYVDKTGFAKQLIDEGTPHYFMSRPRRFGKSLFLDTLEEIFKGNKELFKGCQIYDSDYEWQEHPVLHFDFAQILNQTSQDLEDSLKRALAGLADLHNEVVELPSPKEGLVNLVKALSKKNRVVVLVDEYDSPIINNLKNLEIAEQNRNFLKDFFGALKGLDKHLKFTFFTGVSKFSHVSLFSGLNNLTDITMDPEYAGLMGYSEEELRQYFDEQLEAIAQKRNQQINPPTKNDVLEEVRRWYNGYRFSDEELSVYNPYSTLRFLSSKKAESYWYSTGTPSFLIDEIKKHPRSIVPLTGTTASKNMLSNISSLEQIDLAALMFQTGYLTISGYDSITNRYQLDFPNQEVIEAFLETLINNFANIDPTLSTECQETLENQNLNSFFDQIKTILSSFPYQLFVKATESTYQGMLLGILKGMSFGVYGEKITNLGRIDLIIEMPQTTYILELKLDSTPETALNQILEKKYHEQFLQKGKEIALVGVNFSSKSRNIDDWKASLYSSSGDFKRELKS